MKVYKEQPSCSICFNHAMFYFQEDFKKHSGQLQFMNYTPVFFCYFLCYFDLYFGARYSGHSHVHNY